MKVSIASCRIQLSIGRVMRERPGIVSQQEPGVGSGHGAQSAWAAHWDLGAATVPTISHLKTLIGTGDLATGGGESTKSSRQTIAFFNISQ